MVLDVLRKLHHLIETGLRSPMLHARAVRTLEGLHVVEQFALGDGSILVCFKVLVIRCYSFESRLHCLPARALVVEQEKRSQDS